MLAQLGIVEQLRDPAEATVALKKNPEREWGEAKRNGMMTVIKTVAGARCKHLALGVNSLVA